MKGNLKNKHFWPLSPTFILKIKFMKSQACYMQIRVYLLTLLAYDCHKVQEKSLSYE